MQEVSSVRSHHFGMRSSLHIPESERLEDHLDEMIPDS
jgi:hypothetical protein